MLEKITIDKSGANTAAITSIHADSGLCVKMRQSKYLNNIVDQDHRAVKRITRPMLGFKTFGCARIQLAGIELIHMIRLRPARRDQTPSLVCREPVLLAGFLTGLGFATTLGPIALLQQN